MRRAAGGIIYLVAGAAAGAFSAYLAIEKSGVEAIARGSPWQSRAGGLSGDAAIYVRSHYLIQGRLPPATGQIMEATANTDAEGKELSRSCRYRIESTGALPVWWSLATVEAGTQAPSRQSTIDTDTAIRESSGSLAISVSSGPQSGNWLKSPDSRTFTVLYSAVLTGGQARLMPPFAIKRAGCP